MINNKINNSEKPRYYFETIGKIVLLFIFLSLFGFISGFFFYSSFSAEYFDINFLNLGVIFLLVYIFVIYRFIIISKLQIEYLENGINIIYFFKSFDKFIEFKDIKLYSEIETEEKGGNISKRVLIVDKHNKQILIDEDVKNYKKLIKTLKSNNVLADYSEEPNTRFVKYIVIGYIIVTILILITSAISSSLYYPISNEQIITISGTVDTIEEELSRDKYDGLTINFNEYPNITFHININDLDENVANDILTNQKYLNTIFIQIYDRDYKLKISKEIKPGFFEMHFGWSGLKVYGLKTKNEINFSKFGFETNE